jgi:syntaxin 7
MSFVDAMSRQGGVASSSGGASYGSASADDAFAAESRVVASAIFQATTIVTSFKRLVDALGTPKDTRDLRMRLHRQRDSLGQIAKDTTAAVKRLSDLVGNGGPGAKATQTKLVKDFQAVLKEFQKAQRLCAEREAAFIPQGGAGSSSGPQPFDGITGSYQRSESIEKTGLLNETQRLETLQLDGEIDYNNALIEEREAGIAEIQSQIGEVRKASTPMSFLN